MLSPLTYELGPDEDYYQRFGQAVAAGHGQDSSEFTFMDPAYGYLLGGIFRLVGVNLFVVYVLQALLDTATAYAIVTIGTLLGRPRAGLYGAVVYGLTATSAMYCAALLKEVWVIGFLAWWVVAALVLLRPGRTWAWLPFGVYCGLGVAFRSTLLLMGAVALLLPVVAAQQRVRGTTSRAGAVALVACGIVLGLLPWSLRNDHAYGSLSPLPHNGGIVLHQLYNDQNPMSEPGWIPSFVNYPQPSEIWRGYRAEAEKRAARPLSPPQVDGYWRDEALSFIRQHPTQVLGDMLRKSMKWLANTEIPTNRFYLQEKLFSPVLRLLPAPAAWLLALGLAGLACLAFDDRRWPLVAAPIVLSLVTAIVFAPEARFRFHAAAMLALCSGIWIDRLATNVRGIREWRVAGFVALAALVGAASMYLGTRYAPPPIRWDRIVWGYIKMGNVSEARKLAESIAREQPANGAILEALGYVAVVDKHYAEAEHYLERAIALRPRSDLAHYNLACVFRALGDRSRAAAEATIAVNLNPSPDYKALLTQLGSDP